MTKTAKPDGIVMLDSVAHGARILQADTLVRHLNEYDAADLVKRGLARLATAADMDPADDARAAAKAAEDAAAAKAAEEVAAAKAAEEAAAVKAAEEAAAAKAAEEAAAAAAKGGKV